MGSGVALIDSAGETAAAVAEVLAELGLLASAEREESVTHRFAVSDDPERFRAVGARFLGERLAGAEVISLGTV
jgi:glutamate racemase